ncbi:purine hydroxylase gamma subunit apoprotein [Natronincola peptidivorans]|uniref:Purine hydroxylase gamma subunit apoprotein n=1 Tax=Natronincola peptidivorans TaxID=426128 RepID=A0A1I0F4F9_9FIRM|nr:FAD binding domain-containing protein [Natronincola peptidivorans]SET52906.1 purine hydroxylase gamma subunit apoprotein [Natronincola peptidivorans]
MEIKEVFRKKNVKETLEILEHYQEQCKIIAGGTDIIIQLREGIEKSSVLVDISNIEELKVVKETEKWIEIGSGVTFTEIAREFTLHDKFSALVEAAASVGSPQIRNAATIGGNICNASPAADFIPPLLALNAVVVLERKNAIREMCLEEFIIDKEKVALKADELLTKIRFKKLQTNQGLGFSKLGFRKALAISKISTAVFLELEENNKCKGTRIATGALGRHGLRERRVEEFLQEKALDPSTVHQGGRKLQKEIEKRLYGRPSLAFKKEAVIGIFHKAVDKAFKSCKIEGGI